MADDTMPAADLLQRLDFLTVRESSADHPAYNVEASNLLHACRVLRDEFGYNMLIDATAIDWGEGVSPRFSGLYHLLSSETGDYLRLAADCPADDDPQLPSLCSLWSGANWLEREIFDMFGIRFDGHPDMRRILMWDGYPYFPLRKEFPLAGIETELPAPDVSQVTGAKVEPAPMMGGPFHAPQTGPMSKREPRARDETWTEKKPKPGA